MATPRCMLGARACVMYLSECSTSRIRGYHGTDTLAGIGLDCTGFMADCNVGWSDEAMTACWLCSVIAGLVIQLFASHCAWQSILRSWLQLSVRLSVCLSVCLSECGDSDHNCINKFLYIETIKLYCCIVCLFVWLSQYGDSGWNYLSVRLFVCLSVSLNVGVATTTICPSVCSSICLNVQTAITNVCLIVWLCLSMEIAVGTICPSVCLSVSLNEGIAIATICLYVCLSEYRDSGWNYLSVRLCLFVYEGTNWKLNQSSSFFFFFFLDQLFVASEAHEVIVT